MLPILPKMDSVGLLVARGLGRRHVRRGPALPRREPVGATADHQAALPQHAAADAAARAEPRRLSPLLRRDREPVRLRVQAQRHRGLPRVRRAERHPQRRGIGRGDQGVRRPVRGRHLLHGEPRPHARLVPRVRAGAQGPRCGHDLHQGHGGHADAVPHREDGSGAQDRDRASGARALPLHRRHGPDELREGRRGGSRHRRHGGRLARLRQQPAGRRDHRRGAHGVAVRHRARSRPALRDRRVLGGCPRAQAAQARYHHAAVDGGLQPPGPGRDDEQPRLASSRRRRRATGSTT